jgi:outer membrane biosynthesis protein TonB
MKRFLMGLFCALLSAATLAAGPNEVRKRVQASMLLTGKIVVAPDGSVRSYVVDKAEKVPPAVISLIANNVPKWKFEPTLLDGKPVAAEAEMSFRVVAKPIGDENFSISINGAEFGRGKLGESISSKKRVTPVYPPEAAHSGVSGTVYLLLRVGRQGQVVDAVAEQVNMTVLGSDTELERWRQVLANSALRAARQWTFDPPTSGKGVDAEYWLVRVPVNFNLRIDGMLRSGGYGQWQAYVPGPRQPVPWFDNKPMASTSADALPDGDIQQVDQGLHLTSPLNGT